MDFRIADTFTDSLTQRRIAEGGQDGHVRPADESGSARPAVSRIDKSKDRHFWSTRVKLDLRHILHRTEQNLLCYVARHDDAYEWARRRKLEMHPMTRAAQLVELRGTVRGIIVPIYVEGSRPALFAALPNMGLLMLREPSLSVLHRNEPQDGHRDRCSAVAAVSALLAHFDVIMSQATCRGAASEI